MNAVRKAAEARKESEVRMTSEGDVVVFSAPAEGE